MPERRPVRGYEGYYEVDEEGGVWSVGRVIMRRTGNPQSVKPRKIKNRVGTHGYPVVSLSRAGVTRKYLVHRLVAEAFIPNPRNLPVVMHLDDDRLNPRVRNLAWGTQQDNVVHAVEAGRMRNGTEDQTRCIRGHEFTPENTYLAPGSPNQRHCRECNRYRKHRRRERNRDKSETESAE